jgi:iron complex outermembrane receptor protein
MLRRKVLSLGTALVSLVASGLAVAQETTTPPPAPPPAAEPAPAAAPAAAAGKEEKTEEITVTGTRIRRKDLSTPAPVTVINRDQIQASGKVSIGDFLQAMPEQGNAINTGVNNGGDGSTRVNLRGVGTNRTLVLVNGRRWMPGGTGADGSADLNSIPTAVIERIEVLKDGASAVYGSDAIAGVVNIITRRGGARTDASAYTGTSGHGDATTFDLNLTTGTSGDRGSVLFSAGYFNQQKAMAGDRSFSKIPYFFDATGNNNGFGHVGPYSAGSGTIPDGRVVGFTRGVADGSPLWNSLVTANPTSSSFIWQPAGSAGTLCGASASGQTSCFRPYAGAGLPDAGDPGDGYNFAPENYLITPQQRISLFSTGDLQLGGGARGFFEASYVNRRSRQALAPEPLVSDGEGVAVAAANAYNPLGKELFVRRRLSEFGQRVFTQDLDTFRILGGFDGTLPETLGPLQGWFWDVNANYGRTQGSNTKQGNLYLPALAAAMGPSFLKGTDASGASVFGCGTSAATEIAGCVPLNMFGGPGSITPDQVSGLTFTGTARGTNTLTALQANTSGELVRLMSDRPVGLAAGYEFRVLSGSFINDPITAKGLTTGNKGLDTQGSYSVNEVYGELSIPLVSGMPGVEDLEATAAVRWFDYSNFGSDSTYKLGARYRPIRDITVRGTYSTAFRAPNIGELFGGRADNFPSVKDPCRGAAAGGGAPNATCLAQGVPAAGSGDTSSQLRSLVGGNPDLGPETAKIYTLGLVVEPRMVKNLSVTLDYYHMAIDKNISSIGESVILAGCYDGTNPGYCNLIIRNPSTHFIDTILNLQQNVGSLKTAGIDFAIRYAIPTPAYGRFGLAFDATWLQMIDQTLADGTVVKGKNTFDLNTLNSFGQSGGTFPTWKFNAGVTWGLGGLGAGVSTRFLSAFHECGDSNGDFAGVGLCYVDSTYSRRVSAYHTEDLFVSYALSSFAGKTNIMAGVQNVFDANPAKIYNGFASQTDQYNYDQIGRFFYVRLAQSY